MDPETILQFWFGKNLDAPDRVAELSALWFGSSPAFDERIGARFGELPSLAAEGRFAAWRAAPRSSLALVLVLDQLPRNLYRGGPRSFAFDHLAVGVARTAIAWRFDQKLHPLQAAFFYMPFEHAEALALQQLAVERFRCLVDRAPRPLHEVFRSFLDYALRHQDVIRRFGRFPHRNRILGRPSTDEEQAYLAAGGETFGGRR
jgi:uncharacterized protein (DUF924 family)